MRLDGQTHTVSGPRTAKLLDVLLAAGLDAPFFPAGKACCGAYCVHLRAHAPTSSGASTASGEPAQRGGISWPSRISGRRATAWRRLQIPAGPAEPLPLGRASRACGAAAIRLQPVQHRRHSRLSAATAFETLCHRSTAFRTGATLPSVAG